MVESIHVVMFKRCVKVFSDALLEQRELAACFTTTPHAAKVFVQPEIVEAVQSHISSLGVKLGNRRVFWTDLKPWHVVASDAYIQQVLRVAKKMPGKHQVKAKTKAIFTVALTHSDIAEEVCSVARPCLDVDENPSLTNIPASEIPNELPDTGNLTSLLEQLCVGMLSEDGAVQQYKISADFLSPKSDLSSLQLTPNLG